VEPAFNRYLTAFGRAKMMASATSAPNNDAAVSDKKTTAYAKDPTALADEESAASADNLDKKPSAAQNDQLKRRSSNASSPESPKTAKKATLSHTQDLTSWLVKSTDKNSKNSKN